MNNSTGGPCYNLQINDFASKLSTESFRSSSPFLLVHSSVFQSPMTDHLSPDEHFLNLVAQPQLPSIRERLTLGRCSMLDLATKSNGATKVAEANPNDTFYSYLRYRTNQKTIFDCQPQFSARQQLISAYAGNGSLDEAITDLVDAVQEAWKHDRLPMLGKIDNLISNRTKSETPLEPSFMQDIVTVPRIASILRNVANRPDVGWSHPGLQLSGEMLAALIGDARKPELTVRTKIMFASDHQVHPKGVLADLTVERMGHGCGLLIPDAYDCGYLWMPGGSFANGLQNALLGARRYIEQQNWHLQNQGFQYDWRWRIDLLSATKDLHIKDAQLPITGRSAEVAIACSLIAAGRGNPDNAGGVDPLDPHFAATATLASEPVDIDGVDKARHQILDEPSIPLWDVTSIKTKTLVGGEFAGLPLGNLERERLSGVVVAHNQLPGTIPKDERFKFFHKAKLGDAYGQMVRFPRITRKVNQVIASRARSLRRERCKPYIMPDIEEVIEKKQQPLWRSSFSKGDMFEGEFIETVSLSRLEIKQLHLDRRIPSHQRDQKTLGGNTGVRVRIFADGGLGKSMFILKYQEMIARKSNNLLPLRFGRTTEGDFALSAIDRWNSLTIQGLAQLAELATQLNEAFPDIGQDKLSLTERVEWLQWMVDHGNVVFLLDALDQSTRTLEDFEQFLSGGTFLKCSAILTGRREARQTQNQAFRGVAWRTLQLKPFDRARQAKYLGKKLSERLLPKNEKVKHDSDADELRRHQWKALLEVPLLLNMMKDLASADDGRRLRAISSRNDLYHAAVDYLIELANREKLEDQSHKKLIEGEEQSLLGEVAWHMVREHDFNNLLVGKRFDQLSAYFRKKNTNLLDAVARLALATVQQIVETTSAKALAFRHRSFMEFFAACHLMGSETDLNGTETPFVKPEDRQKLLLSIHATLDEHGEWLPHILAKRNRPADWMDTLRFALAHAQGTDRDALAKELIELGNPWVVYQSIARDSTKYSKSIEFLARWLVHRQWSFDFDYRKALSDDFDKRNVVELGRKALQETKLDTSKMLGRSTRDAAWMSPLRELVGDLRTCHTGSSKESRLLDQLRSQSNGEDNDSQFDFLNSFVSVEGGVFDISQYDDHKGIEPSKVSISNFELADFPVTNQLFELFCPTHRLWRDQHSEHPGQPCIYVNWYMATEFCHWLTSLYGRTYRLPTEWEWEWACRWRDRLTEAYWWGQEMRDDICWYGGVWGDGPAKGSKRTRSRSDSLKAHARASKWHGGGREMDCPGLLDMSGNVWEWCQNLYNDVESSRSLRGGSWDSSADRCRSSYHYDDDPGFRYNDVGFRVCRE